MSEFYPGLEVVCVDDAPHLEWLGNRGCVPLPLGVVSGQHYVISWCGVEEDGVQVLRLVGVTRPGTNRPIAASRFRPIRPETIAIFREMCQPKRGKARV